MGAATVSTITLTLSTSILSDATYTNGSGVGFFDNPTGGVMQFKGVTNSATEKTYVQTTCMGIAPMFYTTAWQNLSGGTSNGWMVTCMTGIPGCVVSLADGTTALSSSVITSCMADPRYMNWRMVTHKINWDGAQIWYRTDSYWDSAATTAASTMGGGIQLSANYASGTDNNGSTSATD